MTAVVDELAALLAAATPGPWIHEGAEYGRPSRNVRASHQAGWPMQGVAYGVGRVEDAALIVAAVNALPDLLAQLAAVTAERDAATAELHGIRFRLEVACMGYAHLTDDDVPGGYDDLATYQEGAADAAIAIRSAALDTQLTATEEPS